MATLTFEVSDSLLTRARETAQALERPLEEVLVGALAVGLPDVHGAPESVRNELLEMTFLDEESLWRIAKDEMASTDQRELQALLDVQRRPLFPREEVRLQALRESYGKAMLRKARALALLSLRGGQPLLEALDVSE
ncbi:MAG: hypothetical protein F4148_00780 [Caldilineaceae bacterium SB0675_bin_29]|uniref:Uncharacterized protein n=1 Tax=Caldilineaceae bacterium SB0675_bin_29 TaxID=2605266 RepID=A0A6B1FUS9_9CHLR|nr:hypothetical protein [Caldilineaceae bacterium SB0675_bin_29]